MKEWIRGLRTAFAFLTRLPVRSEALEPADLAGSTVFFPVVGLALGLACAGLGRVCAAVGLPRSVSAVLVVAALAALTGGLHLDGLADLFDGIAGGRGDRERTLAIMRDSRIGAQGALALALVLALKMAAVHELLAAANWAALVGFPAVARWAVLGQLAWAPYARPEGMGRAFQGAPAPTSLLATSIFMVIVIAMLGRGVPWQVPAAIAVSGGLGVWMCRRLGGLTGDVYGATIELCEAAALIVSVRLS